MHWRRVRAQRLELVGHLCELRHPGCTGKATSVDLIGGGDRSKATIERTRAACAHCHGVEDGGRPKRAILLG